MTCSIWIFDHYINFYSLNIELITMSNQNKYQILNVNNQLLSKDGLANQCWWLNHISPKNFNHTRVDDFLCGLWVLGARTNGGVIVIYTVQIATLSNDFLLTYSRSIINGQWLMRSKSFLIDSFILLFLNHSKSNKGLQLIRSK